MSRPTFVLALTFALATDAAAQTARPAAGDHDSNQQQSTTIQAGTYDLEIAMGGGTRAATLVLTAIGDSLDVKISLGDHGPSIKSVTRKGSHLTVNGGSVGAVITYQLNFTGSAVDGTVSYNDEGGTVTGKRRK